MVRWLARREAAQAYEVDADGVGTGKGVDSGAVGFGVAGCGRRERNSASPLLIPLRCSRV